MRYTKLSSSRYCLAAAVCLAAFPAWAEDPQQAVSACLENGKKAFSAKDYKGAKEVFTQCVKMDSDNEEALLSLAGILLTTDDLSGAEKYFSNALKNMKRTSPYWSYTYSMLGDIALKRQQNNEALKMYSKSLEYNAANVNSLVGKGVIVEYQGDKKGAAGYYRSALAVEPMNVIARKRLVNLEPFYMTDEELLEALKQRYAIAPDATKITKEDRSLFGNIHKAEQRRGIEYLKNKYPRVPTDYLATINKNTGFEREMLTLAGYQALQKHIGQDAIGVFQKVGVPIQSVFDLRDMKGEKLFKEDSTLTDSGYFAYTEALQNRKAFLLPTESVPPTKAHMEKVTAIVQELKDAGYVEITNTELQAIQDQTQCSEETLRAQMGLYMLPVTATDRRYFVLTRSTSDQRKGIAYYFLMKAHAQRNPRVKVPSNSMVEGYVYYGYPICMADGKPSF